MWLCFLLFIVCCISQRIESLVLDDCNIKLLVGKKLGYFVGSFDPLHLGHAHVVETSLKEHYVDYVLIYPVYGRDNFKTREDLKWRQQMLTSVYGDHPQVFVTNRTPLDLQNMFANYNERIEIIGIIGSDVVTDKLLSSDRQLRERIQKGFMRGTPIPKEYMYHTIGSLMALKAGSFIVALRGDVDLSALKSVGDRPIEGFIQSFDLSSTDVREMIQSNGSIKEKIFDSVLKIIEKENLYHSQ